MAAAIYGTDQADIVEKALSEWFKRKLTPKIIEDWTRRHLPSA
jgi:hypothetical protein